MATALDMSTPATPAPTPRKATNHRTAMRNNIMDGSIANKDCTPNRAT
jgi:hypothetical protein